MKCIHQTAICGRNETTNPQRHSSDNFDNKFLHSSKDQCKFGAVNNLEKNRRVTHKNQLEEEVHLLL